MPRFCDSLRRLLSLCDCVCNLSLTRASLPHCRDRPGHTDGGADAGMVDGWLVFVPVILLPITHTQQRNVGMYNKALSTNVPDVAGLRQWLIQRWPLHWSLLILDDLNCCCPRTAWPRDADVRRDNMSGYVTYSMVLRDGRWCARGGSVELIGG